MFSKINFKKFRSTAVIFILLAGIAASYFIVKNSMPASGSASISANELNDKINQGIQEIKDKLSNQPLAENPIQWLTNNAPSDSVDDNFTQTIGQGVFDQIQSTDLSGQASADVSASADAVIQQKLSDLNLISDISNSGLKISQDNSKEAKIKYIEGTFTINEKDMAGVDKSYWEAISSVFKDLDTAPVLKLADIYKNLANDYSNLAVPSDWLNTHKAMIIHLRNSEIVFRAMADYPNDPVKGYAAFELFNGLLDNYNQIQSAFNDKIKEIQ